MRIWHSVWTDKTIVTEIAISSVIRVKVATISINHSTILSCPSERLIDEIPYISTLNIVIFADKIPVFLEATLRVAHCMCIFTLDQRTGHALVLAIPFCVIIIGIHRTSDICEPFARRIKIFRQSTLVMYRARRIHLLDEIVGILEILAHASLVAERPYYDRRVIEGASHITFIAFNVSFGESRILGKSVFAITHAMTFYICLSRHIYAIFVA